MSHFNTLAERITAEHSAFDEFRAAFSSYFQDGSIYVEGSEIIGYDRASDTEILLGLTFDIQGLLGLRVYLVACPAPSQWV